MTRCVTRVGASLGVSPMDNTMVQRLVDVARHMQSFTQSRRFTVQQAMEGVKRVAAAAHVKL